MKGQSFNLGLNGGATQYMGDLSEQNIVPETTQPVAGISLTYNTSPHFGIRLGASAAYIEGDDQYAEAAWQQNRNLSFRTDIIEASLVGVINFWDLNETGITPYIFGGVAGFYYNPRAEFQGDWYDLRELNTEGQGTSAYPDRSTYEKIALALPFGGGLKLKLNKRYTLGLEAGLRKTFTDYLDDVGKTYVNKQVLLQERGVMSATLSDRSGEVMAEPPIRETGDIRGNPEVDDYYGFGTINLIISLGDGGNKEMGQGYGCPVKL